MMQDIFKEQAFNGQVFYKDAGNLFPVSPDNDALAKRYAEFSATLTS